MEAGRRLTLWDVFDDEALFLGQVHLPRGFAPHRVRGLVVYGVERDEMGVEYVVVYRVASE